MVSNRLKPLPRHFKPGTPLAVRQYMREFDESEAEFRAWFDRQRKAYYGQPDNSGGSFTWWVALKMGCTRSQADKVIEWMEAP